jgi:RNase adapter protein RapZ
VTGMSGAGKSTVLDQLEDLGWEVVDNMPLSLLPVLLSAPALERPVSLAIGVDSRTRGFSSGHIDRLINELQDREDLKLSMLFMECEDAVLIRRFTETRRRHPLAMDRPVTDGIPMERHILRQVKDRANRIIDTSRLSLPELKRLVSGYYTDGESPALNISIQSFSYKGGLPREADLVFDVRFLRNPHYNDGLRDLTGEDSAVGDYVASDSAYDSFFEHLCNLLQTLLPRYVEEGKTYLTIGIGCTGGKHRSVFVARQLHDQLTNAGYFTNLTHRDKP